MSLYDRIKQDILQARKNHKPETTTALSTLIGEAETAFHRASEHIKEAAVNARIVTDEYVIATIKKTIAAIDENESRIIDAATKEAQQLEKQLYEHYLPKQLTDEEVAAAVSNAIKATDGTIKNVMSYIKTHLEADTFKMSDVKKHFDNAQK